MNSEKKTFGGGARRPDALSTFNSEFVILHLSFSQHTSRLQLQSVFGLIWQERRGFTVHPGIVAGAIKRRERMSALAAGHLEDAFILVSGCDHETFARTIRESLYTRHVVVAGQWIRRHVEKTRERAG